MNKPLVLVADDDEAVTASLGLLLKQAGYRSVAAATPDETLAVLRGQEIGLVLQDMNFSRETSGEEGLQLLARIKQASPDLPVVLITAWGSIELAVEGMKAGAADFITKPWHKEQILQSVRTALGLAARGGAAPAADRPTRAELEERYDLRGLVGENPRFLEVLELIGRVSGTDASILITGESGTGKEVVAEAIHRNSVRRKGPLVRVNLGGVPASLFESEMFGHVRGAFTDARRDRQGRFSLAQRGTILLDEIGELDPRSQVKMLRVLQDRTYEVLGTSQTRTLDVRVVSCTNRNLQQAVEEGSFREDLLYRINLISVHLPSLAERRDDVPLLARHLLDQATADYGREPASIANEALAWLRRQDWPGNIRQLKHFIVRAVLISGANHLEPAHFVRTQELVGDETGRDQLPAVGSMTLDDLERSMVLKALEHHGGNISRAADSLGMSRAALYRRMEKYGIET